MVEYTQQVVLKQGSAIQPQVSQGLSAVVLHSLGSICRALTSVVIAPTSYSGSRAPRTWGSGAGRAREAGIQSHSKS